MLTLCIPVISSKAFLECYADHQKKVHIAETSLFDSAYRKWYVKKKDQTEFSSLVKTKWCTFSRHFQQLIYFMKLSITLEKDVHPKDIIK